MDDDLERMARALAKANGSSWTSLMDECHIELSRALGTKPFWRRLAQAAIAEANSMS